MSIIRRKSSPVLVQPSDRVIVSGNVVLSSLDKVLAKVPASSFLFFQEPIHDVAMTIRRALSQALVYYYPIAGRITAGTGSDGVSIQCTGEGVTFVAASANCTLIEVKLFGRAPGAAIPLDELAIFYPAEGCRPTDTLLQMQVTDFTCGGFILGVTFNHAIADGVGLAQFLQAVGELARGLSPLSVIPDRSENPVPGIPSWMIAMNRHFMRMDPLLDLPYHDITIPRSLINHIRAEFGSRFNGKLCTVFEAVIALLWQCRTRAIISNPETPAFLSFTANVRKQIGTKDGYYGNCTYGQLVKASSGTVADGDIMELVRMIKNAKHQMRYQLQKKEHINLQQVISMQELGKVNRYDMLTVQSLRNLGYEEVDFGSGAPAKATAYQPGTPALPVCVMSLPCKWKDGENVLSGCVKKEHVDAFIGEIERFVVKQPDLGAHKERTTSPNSCVGRRVLPKL